MKAIIELNKAQKYLLLLLMGLFVQFYTVPLFGTHLKIYMVLSLVLLVPMGGAFINKHSLSFERTWLFSYICLALSIIWASNFALGFQLILGEIILLTFYCVFKCLIDRLSVPHLEEVLTLSFRMFIYISTILYIVGIACIYVFHNEDSVATHLNETSLRIFGCYKENILPRFMGLAESPNNYSYFANVIFWFFVWKGKTKDAAITLITLICTISSSLYLALLAQVILYYYLGGKLSWKVILACGLLYLGYNYLLQFDEIQAILEDRIIRNSTGSGRFELWEYSWNKISEGPIWGFGINQSRTLFTEREYASSHNNILEMGLSLGYIGCLIYIIFLLQLLIVSLKISKKNNVPFIGQVAIGFVLFGFSNNTLHIEFTVFAIALMSYYIRNLFILRMSNHQEL